MNATPATISRRLGRRDAFWLLVALLFHAPLLLIPVTSPISDGKSQKTLFVILAPRSIPETTAVVVPELFRTFADPKPELPQQPSLAEQKLAVPASEPAAVAPQKPNPNVTAAGLADYASRFRWNLPEPGEKRQLGVHRPGRETESWRSRFGPGENLFDGMTVPEKAEIVDQWLAPDGSRNVVINTITGQTLCGRAHAWDPMNPLVENVMQFRTCGGGGKRTFEMPDRFTRHLVD